MLVKICTCLLGISISFTSSFDIFEGLGQMPGNGPCFKTVNDESCDSNAVLSDFFTPPYKGADINPMNTNLWLFTAKNPEKAEPLHSCGGKLPDNSGFDPNVDTVAISHGWLDGVCRTAWMREIKEQLMMRDNYNVILLDWTWGNSFDPLEAGGANAYVAGEDLAFVLMNIMKQKNITGDKVHLVGHSYGTYVVGECARFIYQREPQNKVRRLTLLDPAIAPLRLTSPKTFSTDYAKFVDVIHGDTGKCVPIEFGVDFPVGHADFYPNGGHFQIACFPYIITSLMKGDLLYGIASLLYPPICSHLQPIQFFKVSINHPQGLYIGAECENYGEFLTGECQRCCSEDFSKCAVMGMDAEKYFPHLYQPASNRSYYLTLGIECPYNEDYYFSVLNDCKGNATQNLRTLIPKQAMH